jgi:hypothetical protein
MFDRISFSIYMLISFFFSISFILFFKILAQDQLLSVIGERLKMPELRDCEDAAMLALSSHAVSLAKAENSMGDMSQHTKLTSNLLFKAKNKVAEKRRLEKLEEALKDGFVW